MNGLSGEKLFFSDVTIILQYLKQMATLIQNALILNKSRYDKGLFFNKQIKKYEKFFTSKLKSSLSETMIIEKFTYSWDCFNMVFRRKQSQPLVDLVIHIDVNLQDESINGKVFFKFNELCKNVKSRKLITFLFRYLISLNSTYGNQHVFAVDNYNGLIFTTFKIFTSLDIVLLLGSLFQEIGGIHIYTRKLFYMLANFTNQMPPNLLEQLHMNKFSIFQTELKSQNEGVQLILKHLFNSFSPFFTTLKEESERQKIDLKPSLMRSEEEKSTILYSSSSSLLKKINFDINIEEYAFLNNQYLKLPSIFARYPENPYTFNFIQIQNQIQTVNPRVQGGRNRILLARMVYSYVDLDSRKNKMYLKPKSNLITKNLAIKIPKNQPPSKYDIMKIQHEDKIVRIFTKHQSIYVPRYYQTAQENFPFKHFLLMDFFHPPQTLQKFIKKNQNISFSSLLYVMVNILQGIRFLQDCGVVHMDLKFENILVVGNLLTKIIDFSESYHKDVPETRSMHSGYTLPYASPQRFSTKNYSTKTDMYSLGILMYKAFFQKYPFSLNDKLLIENLKKETYQKRVFFAPESLAYTGYEKIMMILMKFIDMCMSSEMGKRPEPLWGIIVLKQIFYWLQDFNGFA